MEYREIEEYDRAFSTAAAEDLRREVDAKGINAFILEASLEFHYPEYYSSVVAAAELLRSTEQTLTNNTDVSFLRGASIGLHALRQQLPSAAWQELTETLVNDKDFSTIEPDREYSDLIGELCQNGYFVTASAYNELIEGWMGSLAPADPRGAHYVRLGFGFVFYAADYLRRHRLSADLNVFAAEIDSDINWDRELRDLTA